MPVAMLTMRSRRTRSISLLALMRRADQIIRMLTKRLVKLGAGLVSSSLIGTDVWTSQCKKNELNVRHMEYHGLDY